MNRLDESINRRRVAAAPPNEHAVARNIGLLPATAESLFQNTLLEPFGWKGTLKALLEGTRDEESNSTLAALCDHETTLVRNIYSYISNQWASHVKHTIPAALVGSAESYRGRNLLTFNQGRYRDDCYKRTMHEEGISSTSSGYEDGFVSFSRCGKVDFPEPENRNVNMLPFIFGKKTSLPEGLQCYHELIEKCPFIDEEIGKVGYLTVHESYVESGKMQRREGLHIESPGVFSDNAGAAFTPGVEHAWGMGLFWGPDKYEGGIYMASNISNTSEVWDILVDKTVQGIVDKHGNCEHLRRLFGQGTKLQAGELIWMTDCTPHEALPQEEPGVRQFFRVVTPRISHWYAKHSTPNPNVPLPPEVTIVHENKFDSYYVKKGKCL